MRRTLHNVLCALYGFWIASNCISWLELSQTRADEDEEPAASGAEPLAELNAQFERHVLPVVRSHCTVCHGEAEEEADLDLAAFEDARSALADLDVWEQVLERLRTGEMPPEERSRPEKLEIDATVAWIEAALAYHAATARPDPGRVTVRRLNRAEYKNTIRDLLGVEFEPADRFPADDVGYGFDNIGDVLSLSPVLMERYMEAAEEIAASAIVAEPGVKIAVSRLEAERFKPDRESGGGRAGDESLVFFTNGSNYRSHEFPLDGEYVLRIRAFGYQAGEEPPQLVLRVGGDEVATFDVNATRDKPEIYEARATLEAGRKRIRLGFTNDYYQPDDPDPANRDRNLAVDYVEVDGPYNAEPPPLPETHQRIFLAHPESEADEDRCAGEILTALATRAFRRPASPQEVARLAELVHLVRSQGDTFERGVQLALKAILVSPHFLFRIERDTDPLDATAVHKISPYELATRLSYFLWSSMPDEELLARAEDGSLREPNVLEAQVTRMLADSKSHALVENFAGQWLQLRNLESMTPDPDRFPGFDEDLRAAMRLETEQFFEAVMREDRSVIDFLDANFTFLNGPLAEHYGIDGIEGDEFRRVELDGSQRSGVLTQASILTVTSNPTRTSPVKRGRWVLENILGDPPSEPPDGVEALAEDEQAVLTGSLRQRMEQHRANASCAVCHTKMDALGFGLENYDAIGAWRTHDGEFEIDASGTLPGERAFATSAELKTILTGEREAFCRCLVEKLLTYSLGRGLERYDRPAVETICDAAAENDYRFSQIVVRIALSDPFQMRRGDGGDR